MYPVHTRVETWGAKACTQHPGRGKADKQHNSLSCVCHTALQDHTLFKKKGRTECPPEARCLNCMPKPGKDDDYECWAIKKPVLYKVRQLSLC
jgi:hypothetical protein